MKTLTVAALVCALMALAGALPLLPEETDDPFLFERAACPNGWTEVSGRCFIYVHFARSWPEAERDCLSMGANLASIHSISEYHEVQKVIATATHDYGAAWAGGSDSQQNGVWLWSDASRFDYSNWCPGEPNNDRGQDCLQINYSGSKCWDDDHCGRHKPYVCAMKSK